MEHNRFDALAKQVFDGTSRRRVLGGALASVVGAGIAAVTGASAKNDKGKGKAHAQHKGNQDKGRAKAQGKKGKGKARGEFTCTAANANVPAQGGCPPLTCCNSTPGGVGANCVSFGLQAGSSTCGRPGDGQGVCRTCPTGTRCSGFPFFRCVCDSTSCANGCCINNSALPGNANDACIANGSGAPVSSENPKFDGRFVCGSGGGQCTVCGSTGLSFTGCCTATGACSLGTSNVACGSNGQLCTTCQNDSSCGADQACTGGTTTTTTTTTPAPTPTTPAPPRKKKKR